MDEIKVYKPGQLITINNKVYRIKALVEEKSQTFTKEEIEKIKKLKEIINNNYICGLSWSRGDVYYYRKSTYRYVRAFSDNNFSLLKKIINLCLNLSVSR